MRLIDTHAHLQFKAYDDDRDEVIKRTSEELEAVVNVGTSIDATEKGIALAKEIKNFFAATGVHPHHVDQWDEKTASRLDTLVKNEKVVAIGEIGLDNHFYKDYPKPNITAQTEILHEQINLAVGHKKPVLFHCRNAYDELFGEIKNYKGKIDGLMHCFMGSWEQAKKFLDMGLSISFSGNITYKKNDYIRDVAKKIPKDKILVETDAPFLPPEPHRGKRSEPIYVKIVATTLSNLKGWAQEETANITSQNAKNLLKISL
jgi:TatD DNase family protein